MIPPLLRVQSACHGVCRFCRGLVQEKATLVSNSGEFRAVKFTFPSRTDACSDGTDYWDAYPSPYTHINWKDAVSRQLRHKSCQNTVPYLFRIWNGFAMSIGLWIFWEYWTCFNSVTFCCHAFLPMRSLLVSVHTLTIPRPMPTANAVPFVPCCGMRAPVEPLYSSAAQQLVCGVHEVGLGFSHK